MTLAHTKTGIPRAQASPPGSIVLSHIEADLVTGQDRRCKRVASLRALGAAGHALCVGAQFLGCRGFLSNDLVLFDRGSNTNALDHIFLYAHDFGLSVDYHRTVMGSSFSNSRSSLMNFRVEGNRT